MARGSCGSEKRGANVSLGYANFGKIQFVDDTATVPFLNSQALVFKVTLPKGSKPLVA